MSSLVDVSQETVHAINERGLRIEDKTGNSETLRIRATTSPVKSESSTCCWFL